MEHGSPHVLIACHAWYDDVIGGSFRLASEFAQHLAQRGLQVTYLCCSTEAASPARQRCHGVQVCRYPPPTFNGRLRRLRYHVHEARKLAQKIHASSAVHYVSSHSPLQGLGAARALAPHGAFLNYTVHSPFDAELLSHLLPGQRLSLTQRLAARLGRIVDRRNIILAHQVQTDSQYTQTDLRQKHGIPMIKKGIVAPGWVDVNQYQPALNRRALRRQLGEHWDTDAPVLFTLRRLESRMGLETLIQACQQLRQEKIDFRMLIGGGGSLAGELQSMIHNLGLIGYVRLLGRIPEEHLASVYAAADCFVLPTRALECFGLIVLEAFACNTPVVASCVAAIPELAARQGDGWMFEPGNASQLADRLKAFLSGKLQPTVDLRAVASEYHKPLVLANWENLLLSVNSTTDSDSESLAERQN
ncbi:MAG: glycosyltransferase family 4 protein [Planctomycetaceae bacterium]